MNNYGQLGTNFLLEQDSSENELISTLQNVLEKRKQYKQQLRLVNWLMQQAN